MDTLNKTFVTGQTLGAAELNLIVSKLNDVIRAMFDKDETNETEFDIKLGELYASGNIYLNNGSSPENIVFGTGGNLQDDLDKKVNVSSFESFKSIYDQEWTEITDDIEDNTTDINTLKTSVSQNTSAISNIDKGKYNEITDIYQ